MLKSTADVQPDRTGGHLPNPDVIFVSLLAERRPQLRTNTRTSGDGCLMFVVRDRRGTARSMRPMLSPGNVRPHHRDTSIKLLFLFCPRFAIVKSASALPLQPISSRLSSVAVSALRVARFKLSCHPVAAECCFLGTSRVPKCSPSSVPMVRFLSFFIPFSFTKNTSKHNNDVLRKV